jgi:serine/threonine protein kinase
LIGKTLSHFTITAKLGEGGMGEVYRATDSQLDREVAIKVLPEAVAGNPDRLARFEREAKAVAALNHPNIVTVFSVEEAEGIHFIAMELVEGQALSELLPRGGFSSDRLLEIAIPLADAVSCAHRSGITHRDLKPDNVMVDRDGRLRVLDFGLAKLHQGTGHENLTQAATAAAVTEEGTILGTVAYMSPEQAEGKEVDPRSDIFSLGTILYEMATGTRPFKGDTSISIIGAILKDRPDSVTELKPSLPNHLGRIIRRCLAKAPDRRYESALSLRNELQDLKSEVDSSDNQKARAHRSTTRSHWAVFGSLAVLGIAVIFAVTYWRASDPPPTLYTPRPLTASLGWEGNLNWSPEGEFITFEEVRKGSLDVMVQSVTGGEAVVRAGGPGDEVAPRWSPDGKYIAYASSSDPESSIFLVPPHGGSPRKLIGTNIRTLDVDGLQLSMGVRPWSADSRTLLVSRIAESGQLAIYRVDRNQADSEQLTFPSTDSVDLSASYSFDGERIVFQRRSVDKGELWTMPAGGGVPQPLLADEFENSAPVWRPDNRHVLFLSNRGGGANPNIWEIDVNGGSPSQVTFESNGVYTFSVSSDDRIAYAPFWHDTFLFTVDVATGERRQLTSHTKNNFGARFSPDGQSVAYFSTRTGNSEIWRHYLDGRSETQITDDDGMDLNPDWSPDGQRLIFVSDREDGQFKIFVANSDGGGKRLLVDRQIAVSNTSIANAGLINRWSPDGKRIGFLVAGEETDGLWMSQTDGQGAQRMLENVTGFDWYLDSRRAFYTRQHGSESEIVAIDLETGREQSLFVGPLMEIDVAPDGSAVAFCLGRGHMGMGLAVLKLEPPSDPNGLPRSIGEPKYVVRTEGTWHVHNGGWSPDSKSLVYTQDQDYGDIYELVERR